MGCCYLQIMYRLEQPNTPFNTWTNASTRTWSKVFALESCNNLNWSAILAQVVKWSISKTTITHDSDSKYNTTIKWNQNKINNQHRTAGSRR